MVDEKRVEISKVLKPELALGRRCILEMAARVDTYTGINYNML